MYIYNLYSAKPNRQLKWMEILIKLNATFFFLCFWTYWALTTAIFMAYIKQLCSLIKRDLDKGRQQCQKRMI